jgi:flavodoxin
MKILIVFDSVFGNTEKLARAMGEALPGAQVVRVIDVTPEHLEGVEGLIVGSPTRAFRPTTDLQKWLKTLPAHSLNNVRAAAFDTRADLDEVNSNFLRFMVGIFGYADKTIVKWLGKKGATLALPSGGFFVQGSEGPLKEGEVERAVEWAMGIFGGQPGR